MRTRLTFVAILALALAAPAPATTGIGEAAGSVVLAQDVGEDGAGADDGEGTQQPGGEDEEGADAETGAGEEEQGDAAGDSQQPWTYQMARIGVVLAAYLAIVIGILYYRMIVRRRKAGL